MKPGVGLILTAASLLLIAPFDWARADYEFLTVDQNNPLANDSNSGTPSSPLKTIQHAVDLANNHAMINVYAGTYNERIKLTAKNSDSMIQGGMVAQVYGFDTRNVADIYIGGFIILNNPAATAAEDKCGIYIDPRNTFTIANNVFQNIHGPAILMSNAQPWSSYTTPDNLPWLFAERRIHENTIDGCSQGIVMYGDGLYLAGNEIKRLVRYPDNQLEPIYMKLAGSNIFIDNTRCYGTSPADVGAIPVKVFDTSEANNSYLRNLTVKNCTFKDYDIIFNLISGIYPGSGRVQGNMNNILFTNNIFAHGRGSGFTVNSYVTRLRILNNIFYEAGSNALSYQVTNGYLSTWIDAASSILNNIFYNTGTAPVSTDVPVPGGIADPRYNFVFTTINGGTNPLFVDAAHDNFHLQQTSPAIDAGISVEGVWAEAFMDVDGNCREQGNAIDIGPYEYQPHALDTGVSTQISGSSSKEYYIYDPAIKIAETYEDPAGDFTFSAADSQVITNGTFSGKININNYTYLWRFGDGSSSTNCSVSKTFTRRGWLSVSLRMTNIATGKVSSDQMYIYVWPAPIRDLALRLPLNGDIFNYATTWEVWNGYSIEVQAAGSGNLPFSAGMPGKGITMDGSKTGPYLTVKHHSLLDYRPYFSAALFAKKTTPSSSGLILILENGYSIEILPQGVTAQLFDVNHVPVTLTSTTIINNDTRWHHYCITYDGIDARLYCDGKVIDLKPLTGKLAYSGATLFIGKNPFTEDTFSGTLDSVRFYDRPLATSEVVTLYSGTAFGDVSGSAGVSAFDASLAARYAVGAITLSPSQIEQADVSADGTVSSFDASMIARYSIGLLPKFDADLKYE